MDAIRSSAGAIKPAVYYRGKLVALRKRADRLAADGSPAALRTLDITVQPKIEWAEGRLRQAERAAVAVQGALACRRGVALAACPVHLTVPATERLFCAWCHGWWDERIPSQKKGRK